jgi:TP901 family phage tail tape measure protein
MIKALQIALVLTALDRASDPIKKVSGAVGTIGKAADAVAVKLEKVKERLAGMADSAERFGRRSAFSGALMVGAVSKVMQPFEDLEDATTRMELAYDNAQGKASRYFDSIRRQTVDLGNKLPGTTKDFTSLATSLKEAAISEEMIANGGLKAAGYLRTVFQEADSKKVAEVVAGSLHAFNLADGSLLKYIDLMQRAHYAFGMTLDDFKYGLPYISRSYGMLNPKGGLAAAKNQTIMMGMLKQGGMEGSMIGESIGSFYTQLATRNARLEFGMGRRGLMTVAGNLLKKYHTDMEVFDKKGSYVGDEALVKKIWLLKKLGATQQEVSIIGNSLAGATGSTLFTKLYQQGPEGWQKAEARLKDQLDLDKKIERLLKTLKNVKEAGLGTITNLAATIGSALAPSLKAFFDLLNDGAGKLQVFFDRQEKGNTVIWKLTKFLMLSAVGLGVLGIALGAGAIAFAAVIRSIMTCITAFQWLTKAIKAFEIIKFTSSLSGLWQGLIAASRAVWALNVALLSNPVTWIVIGVVALAGAAYLVYKNWSKIKEVFGAVAIAVKGALGAIGVIAGKFITAGGNIMRSLWQGMKSAANKPVELMKSIVQKIRNFLPFSPAKEGPLKDIHRIRLVETIADSLRPTALVKAMRTVTLAAAVTAAPVGSVMAASQAAGGAGQGAIQITYAPQVSVQGGGPDARTEFARMLQDHSRELERMIEQIYERKARRAY